MQNKGEHSIIPILLQDLARRGIPQHLRGISWQMLSGAHNSPEKSKYLDYLKTESACEKVGLIENCYHILTSDLKAIHRDIARTYPEHDFFKKKDGIGQEALFNVMKAYSIHDREVGYCQGSAFIVGLLLMQVRKLFNCWQLFISHLDARGRSFCSACENDGRLCYARDVQALHG